MVAGTVIADRYRVLRVLGQGGMGMVLEVTHTQLGGRHALKLLHTSHANDTEMVARFENEARIAAALRSDHLVRVTDMGRLPTGEPFLVMDFLHGADLDQLLETHHHVPVATAVSWILQASLGLAHLHARGVVHRDVKPSNLFWSEEPDGRQVIRVLDFGLAKAPTLGAQRLTATTANFGTPQFMSPEQIMSAKHVDARCDQHALGLVLYELLTGEPAFIGETSGAITVAIATQPAPRASERRSEVPLGLSDVIARSLAKRPDDRYPSLREFSAALAPYAGPEAAELARATAKLLGPGTQATDPLRAAAAATAARISDDSDVDRTLVAPPNPSIAGFTSSTRPKSQRSRRWLFAGVGVAAVAACAAGLVIWRGAAGKGAPTQAVGATAEVSARADEPRSSTPAAPAATTAPPPTTVTPVVTTASAAASASASATAPRQNVHRPPPRASAVPTAKASSAPTGSILDKYRPH
ncbi:MAG: serine/threonine protein kinase [Polyangiaceae bacterium]|nr:serine/threonine protein kinase [Polyangiaceae bacterium]